MVHEHNREKNLIHIIVRGTQLKYNYSLNIANTAVPFKLNLPEVDVFLV